MLAKEADKLEAGDRVVTYNGPYIQQAYVTRVERGKGSIRWVSYKWMPPGIKKWKFGCKRHMSVYLPREDS